MRELAPVVCNAAAWGADVVIDLSLAGVAEDEAITMLGEVAAEVQRRDGRWVVVAMDAGEDRARLATLAALTMKLTTCHDVDEAVALLRTPLPATPGAAEFEDRVEARSRSRPPGRSAGSRTSCRRSVRAAARSPGP